MYCHTRVVQKDVHRKLTNTKDGTVSHRSSAD